MTFYYLVLGHLIGDFTFQTDRIAIMKKKDTSWILLHSFIVTINMLLLSIPFGKKLLFMVIINGIIHFCIDYMKVKLPSKNNFFSFVYFIADQTLHIFIIYLISRMTYQYTNLPFNKATVLFLISFVFILSFSTIFVQYCLRLIFLVSESSFFIKNERIVGNITRVFAFIILFLSYKYNLTWLLALPAIILFISIYYLKSWRRIMSKYYFGAKVTLDLMMSLLGFILLIII